VPAPAGMLGLAVCVDARDELVQHTLSIGVLDLAGAGCLVATAAVGEHQGSYKDPAGSAAGRASRWQTRAGTPREQGAIAAHVGVAPV
jgi:hypothetical protein